MIQNLICNHAHVLHTQHTQTKYIFKLTLLIFQFSLFAYVWYSGNPKLNGPLKALYKHLSHSPIHTHTLTHTHTHTHTDDRGRRAANCSSGAVWGSVSGSRNADEVQLGEPGIRASNPLLAGRPALLPEQ